MGFGTEKIEDELSVMFPLAKIARLDLDATRNKHAHEEIINDFEKGQIDILVGTQMITKGLDFGKVELVGILNADALLFYPDFRAYERSFQLMLQVSGRAGRRQGQGLVLIQTANPGHAIIQYLLHNNYAGMLSEQLTERKDFKYPPFYRLIKLTLKHRQPDICTQAANMLANALRTNLGDRVIGPDKPLINRIQNLYLRNILIKFEREASPSRIKEIISTQIVHLLATEGYKSCIILADVDPA
jgi:primosomal protein N' (replication factor Y)